MPVAGSDDDVLRPGRAVYEVPPLQRPLLALDDEDSLARQQEVLLVSLPVVHRHCVTRLERDEMHGVLLELRLAFEDAVRARPSAGRQSASRALSTNQPSPFGRIPCSVESSFAS